MMRLDKIIKPWKDAGSLNANVNLYGSWDETTFLTKSGDLGIVLKVCGVDFESLDQAGQELAVRRLEAALKSFGPGFHVYQYLFKTNRPEIPFAKYGEPLIDAAVEQRREFFEAKRDRLYSIENESVDPKRFSIPELGTALCDAQLRPKRGRMFPAIRVKDHAHYRSITLMVKGLATHGVDGSMPFAC